MDKFWEWMKKNSYSGLEGITEDIIDFFGHSIIPAKQMLVGYFIEYIRSHEFWNKKEDENDDEFQIRTSNLRECLKRSVIAPDVYFALRDILEILKIL